MSDLTMLRRELVIGYTVAGFLAVLVPTSVWQAVFISGHGFWTSVENAIVGPFIAIISFVCSIGNVPLAAALWSGGISFGGVIAFIFADLIAFPLLLIYRRYYGTRLMLRMLVVFWALMSTAGLLTELLFRAAGLVPTVRPTTMAPAHFSWNYTTYLNLVFLALFGVLYWLYRNRERFGGGDRYARDPVCGMQVETAHAPATRRRCRRAPLLLLRPLCGAIRRRIAMTAARCAAERQDGHCGEERIVDQPEKMVASGRITPVEAARFRAGQSISPSPFTSAPILPISRLVLGDLGVEGVALGGSLLLGRRRPVGRVGGSRPPDSSSAFVASSDVFAHGPSFGPDRSIAKRRPL